jgi:DNA repair photolyase
MLERPPDVLIVQTHSAHVTREVETLARLSQMCEVRCHLSIETDRERLPGLPPHAATVESRFAAAAVLRSAGIRVVITVSPLLPIADPDSFFSRIAKVADAVVLDHFIGGDGSPLGTRTLRTPLPAAMAAVEADSVSLEYRNRMSALAERYLPGRVGYHIDGFAGRMGRVGSA